MEYMIPQNRIVDEMKLNAFINERTIYLTDDGINEETEFIINRMFEKIVERDRKDGINPKQAEPITVKISTYGGDVYATLSIISTIETLKEMGYKIIGKAYGKVMSGGFKILISCSKRICQKHTRLLYHQVQSWEMGDTTVEQSKRKTRNLEEMWNRCRDIIMKYTNITKDTLDTITREDRDVFMWAEEALSLNCVDEII
jgi:ATP-dependent protease ClpP protease subunit